jgi:hypothetical protein
VWTGLLWYDGEPLFNLELTQDLLYMITGYAAFKNAFLICIYDLTDETSHTLATLARLIR